MKIKNGKFVEEKSIVKASKGSGYEPVWMGLTKTKGVISFSSGLSRYFSNEYLEYSVRKIKGQIVVFLENVADGERSQVSKVIRGNNTFSNVSLYRALKEAGMTEHIPLKKQGKAFYFIYKQAVVKAQSTTVYDIRCAALTKAREARALKAEARRLEASV